MDDDSSYFLALSLIYFSRENILCHFNGVKIGEMIYKLGLQS